jgi:hypothetical protein
MNQQAREHAFVLAALLAAAHMLVSITAVEAMSKSTTIDFDYARIVSYALAMSQISLAAIWAVVGRTMVLLRWGALVVLYAVWSSLLWRPFEDIFVPLNSLVWQAAGLIAAMLVLHWRGLRMMSIVQQPIRLSIDDALPAATGPRQFHLEHLFLLMTAVAACVGTSRLLGFAASSWRISSLLGLANAGAAAAICWAIFAPRQFLLRLGVSLGAVFTGGCALGLVAHGWQPLAGLYLFHGLLLAVSLWIFRLCGFRLVFPDKLYLPERSCGGVSRGREQEHADGTV